MERCTDNPYWASNREEMISNEQICFGWVVHSLARLIAAIYQSPLPPLNDSLNSLEFPSKKEKREANVSKQFMKRVDLSNTVKRYPVIRRETLNFQAVWSQLLTQLRTNRVKARLFISMDVRNWEKQVQRETRNAPLSTGILVKRGNLFPWRKERCTANPFYNG